MVIISGPFLDATVGAGRWMALLLCTGGKDGPFDLLWFLRMCFCKFFAFTRVVH
jgi:hypothetical protein